MFGRKSHVREGVFPGLVQQVCYLPKPRCQSLPGSGNLRPGSLLVGLSKDRADHTCNHRLATLGHEAQGVAEEVHPAALPRGAGQHCSNCLSEPLMHH